MSVEKEEIERRMERFKAAARQAGVRLTPQRLEIFREVASSLEHPDAETVHRAIERRMPTVSLDTVYRTLWMLRDLGLVTTLGPRHESVRFDANLGHHHHVVCLRCGSARDFECAELDVLRVPEAVKGWGSVVVTNVEVRGICNACMRKQAGTPAEDNPRQPRRKTRGEKRRMP
jgi:Fur family peroxide stress response transcriptional regulator